MEMWWGGGDLVGATGDMEQRTVVWARGTELEAGLELCSHL
jgi:hypothetical protein